VNEIDRPWQRERERALVRIWNDAADTDRILSTMLA
jgi:hypothetical protein